MNLESVKVLPIKLWQDIANFKDSSINWLEIYQDEFYKVLKKMNLTHSTSNKY